MESTRMSTGARFPARWLGVRFRASYWCRLKVQASAC